MKRIVLTLLLLGMITSLFSRNWRIGWEKSFPYQFKESDTVTGIDIEIPRLVLQEAGYFSHTFISTPWKRQLFWINSGDLDLILGASVTDERKEYAHFSVPYRYEEVALYVRASAVDSFYITSLADLKQDSFRGLGVFSGSYYGEEYARLMEDSLFSSKVEPVSSDVQNLLKLEVGRIDGFLMDPFIAKALIKERGKEGVIVKYPMPAIKVSSLHFMYSKKSVPLSLVQEIDSAIVKLEREGVIDSLISHFLKFH